MSAACFTCSETNGALSPITNACYWNILRSLLLPEQNIEHVCYPNPNLHLCTRCRQMLHCISMFKNVAISSVATQLRHWQQEMEPLGSKTETENAVIKQELLIEDSNSDLKCKQDSLHEEVMLETKEEVDCSFEMKPELPDYTEDNQCELFSISRHLEDTAEYSDGDNLENDEHLRIRMDASPSPKRDSDASWEPDDASSPSPPRQASTSTHSSKKRTVPPKIPASYTKKNKKYYTKYISKKELRAYRLHERSSEQFNAAKYKCKTCIVTFYTKKTKIEHRLVYHSKRKDFTKCVVCAQTMPAKIISKHVAAHFEFIVCSVCGHKTEDLASMERHPCGETELPPTKAIRHADKINYDPYNFF